jgi:hypothetical protein
MIEPYDLQTVFSFRLLLDNEYFNLENGILVIQISYSTDNITYSSFATINANTLYTARYLKFKTILTTSDATHNINFYNNIIYLSAPEIIVDWGGDVAVPVDGVTVTFQKNFSYAPRLKVTVVDGILGFLKVTKTADDFFVQMFSDQAATTPITCEIDWEAKGY